MTSIEAGYSPTVLAIVLVVGLFLAFRYPYVGILMGIGVFLFRNHLQFVHTRFPGIGEYFNLLDAGLLISVIATICLIKKEKGKNFHVPPLALAVVGVVIMGILISWLNYGYTPDMARRAKYFLYFPVAIVIGANAFDNERRFYYFIALIVAAVLVQSINQWVFVMERMFLQAHAFRTIQFASSGQVVLPMMVVLHPYFREKYLKNFAMAAVAVAAVAMILNQGKGFWISQLAGLLALLFCLRKEISRQLMLRLCGGIAVIILGMTAFEIATGGRVDPLQLFLGGRTMDFGGSSISTRWAALKLETAAWLNDGFFVGNGLGYQTQYYNIVGDSGGVAWYHVGWASVLGTFGLIGLAVLGGYLPLNGFKNGFKLIKRYTGGIGESLGALLVVLILQMVIATTVSTGLMFGFNILPGLFLGLGWALSRYGYKPLKRPMRKVSVKW